MLAPISLFTYNRLKETQQTVEALKNNILAKESDLYIFSDAPKDPASSQKVEEVRKYLKTITGFKKIKIIEASDNKGLAGSIISGVTQILSDYNKIIVLEDDLVTNTGFIKFMNDALNYYENDNMIQSVNGFSIFIKHLKNNSNIYFQKRPFPWGWGTWADRWNPDIFNKQTLKKEIELEPELLKRFKKECGNDIVKMFISSINNKNDSWYVRWTYNHFKNDKYSIYPKYSLVENIGFSENGTHCKNINSYNYRLEEENKRENNFIKFKEPDSKTTKTFLNNFSMKHKILVRIRLLFTKTGRIQVKSEIVQKFEKWI